MSVAIDKISFENYRQYGTGQIHFKTDGATKLSILIAKNGTGKTTLLNAITWCLYGQELHLAEGKKALPIVNSSLCHYLKLEHLALLLQSFLYGLNSALQGVSQHFQVR